MRHMALREAICDWRNRMATGWPTWVGWGGDLGRVGGVTWVGKGRWRWVGAGGLPHTHHSPRATYYTPLAVAMPKAGTTYSPLTTHHSRRTVASSS